MTACSSILALGMMPLCLLIYTTTWTSSGTIQIPYDSIGRWLSSELCLTRLRALFLLLTGLCDSLSSSGITLVALLIPIGFGIYVKRRWPRAAKKILKV